MRWNFGLASFALVVFGLAYQLAEPAAAEKPSVELTREQVEEIVLRSYQYVAMFNVNNKFAMDPSNPMNTGGWNRLKANTTLADHTLQAIPRPNNDTLYVGAMLDVRTEPVILEAPAFDSKYVSLMVTGYDHYVSIPMSTRLGDFSKPSRILFYTKRTAGYTGEPVHGVDKVVEMSGDFLSAVYRIMPHLDDPARLQHNLDAMRAIKIETLSEYRSVDDAGSHFAPWVNPSGISTDLDVKRASAEFPEFGQTDFDIFENNLLEVMQFVFNHTTFEPSDKLDRKLIDVYKPLGVAPGRPYDPTHVADIDGALFREVAESTALRQLALMSDPSQLAKAVLNLFLPKGQMTLDLLVFQSVIGPIGQPAVEAIYPPISAIDGKPMNAMHDYVVRMKRDDLPPAKAFWSVTLYESKNGFFIPNDSKKYSVGENTGFKLDNDGGIVIHIAAKKPADVPDENWLPINRGDYSIDLIMRVYEPDLERYKSWTPPRAERRN